VDGRPYLDDNDEFLAADIQASSNLEDFLNTYATPGVEFAASSVWATLYDQASLLDELERSYDCVYDGRYEYDDGLYSGLYDLYLECGDIGSVIVELAAMPEDGSFIIFVQVQAVTDADLDALDQILNTFFVAGELN
jgi:serine protease Do